LQFGALYWRAQRGCGAVASATSLNGSLLIY
jgi:hypothetical protein